MSTVGPILTALLKQYGLESLIPWASKMAVTGASAEEIQVSMYEQKAFKDRFWMMFAHQKNGYGAVSPAEVLEYERSAKELASSFGLKVTDHEIGDWIANGKGLPEQQSRMQLAARAAYQTDATTRQQLAERYGITGANLTSYWLDPKQTLANLERRYVQADIAGAAVRSGFRPGLSEQNLGMLYDRGLTGESAGDAFARLAENEAIFEAVDVTESDISVSDQLKLITGDTGLSQQVERRVGKRRAYFEEGGGFATGKEGVAGLGSAAR